MNLPKDLIIIGGGASVKEGIDKGLLNLLPNSFSVGLNYAYKYMNTTVNMGVDERFWNDNYQELSQLPLYIGKQHSEIRNIGKNTHFLPPCRDYYRDLKPGVYSSTLVGLFSLSLFINLMDEGNIFILGYDYGPQRDEQGKPLLDEKGRPITHFYQGKVEHRGIGKINWYTSTIVDNRITGKRIPNAEKEYRVYKDETKVKIYNVNLQSAIPTFPKISYEEFFTKKLTTELNQNDIREEVVRRLNILHSQMATFRTNPPIYVTNNITLEDKKEPLSYDKS